MKKNIVASSIIAAAVSVNVQAGGFAPWSETGIQTTADREQSKIEIRSYYRANLNERETANGEPQAAIKIVPWYDANRV